MAAQRIEQFQGTRRFRIVRTLGRGGMGEVYEAFDREHGEHVALKTLRYASPQYLYLLKKEFRILQGLHHPNLVRLGELIEERGQWFFTMELLAGVDFLRHVRTEAARARGKGPRAEEAADTMAASTADGEPTTRPGHRGNGVPRYVPRGDSEPLEEYTAPTGPVVLAAPLFDEGKLRAALRGVVDGLEALHAAGLVHRDIKPNNIIVGADDRAVLLDFGLVHAGAGRDERSDAAASVAGTPGYIAPEQYDGDRGSPASDWYGVGVTLYEALTGKLPFGSNPLRSAHESGGTAPRPPSALVRDVPADLDELCVALLAHDPAARPGAGDVRSAIGVTESKPSFGAPPERAAGELVGRAHELAALRRAFAHTRSGEPATVFVSGPSGIGKSALVRHFLDSLDGLDHVVVLTGRCYERESVPYKAFDSLIDDLAWYLRELDDDDLLAVMPARVDALVRLFPVLDLGFAVAPADASPQDLRSRAFEALKQLLRNIAARRELVLFIDDLQWGDADSAALLGELLRGGDAPAMLLLATYRSEAADTPLIRELARRGAEQLEVGPLPDTDARALVEAMAREAGADLSPQAQQIAREAKGSPFVLGEIVRHLGSRAHGGGLPIDSGTGGLVERLIGERLAQLPDDAAWLLRMAAAIGRPVERDLLVRAAGFDKREGRHALDLLMRARLLRSHRTDSVELYHDRVRESVVAGLPPAAVRDIYNRVAHVLEHTHPERAALLGIDFIASQDPDAGLRYAVRAAEQAERAFAFDRAGRLYELAVSLAPEFRLRELQRKHADVLRYGGFYADAARVYEQLADGAAPDERAELMRLAADNLLRAGHIEDGLQRVALVADQLGVDLGRTRTRTLLAIATNRARLAVRGLRYRARAEAECPPDELARLDTMFSVAASLGPVDFLRGAVLQTEHMLAALRLGERRRVCRALATEVSFLAVRGGRSARKAEQLCREALLMAEDLGDPYLIAVTLVGSAYLRFFTGQYPLALQTFATAEEYLESCPEAWWERSEVRYWRHLVQVSMGAFKQLAPSVDRCLREAEERNDRHTISVFKGHPTVWCLLVDDRADRIDGELDAALADWPTDTKYQAHYVAMVGRVMARIYQRRYADALAELDAGEPILHALAIRRIPYIHGEVQKLTGMAAVGLGDRRRAARAARWLERFGVPIARAYAGTLHAALAARDGRDRDARDHLMQSLELFEECGAAHDATATRFRTGQLVGGDRGARLQDEALAWMHDQGVRDAAAMIDFISPGFGHVGAT